MNTSIISKWWAFDTYLYYCWCSIEISNCEACDFAAQVTHGSVFLSNWWSPTPITLEREAGLSHCSCSRCVWHVGAPTQQPYPVLCSTINHCSHPCCSPTEAAQPTTLHLGLFLSLGPAERTTWSGLCFSSFPGVFFSRNLLQKALESIRLYKMVPRETFKPGEKYFKLHIE